MGVRGMQLGCTGNGCGCMNASTQKIRDPQTHLYTSSVPSIVSSVNSFSITSTRELTGNRSGKVAAAPAAIVWFAPSSQEAQCANWPFAKVVCVCVCVCATQTLLMVALSMKRVPAALS
jgi:hypothetical protein